MFSDRDAYSEEEEDEEPTDPKKSDEVSFRASISQSPSTAPTSF